MHQRPTLCDPSSGASACNKTALGAASVFSVVIIAQFGSKISHITRLFFLVPIFSWFITHVLPATCMLLVARSGSLWLESRLRAADTKDSATKHHTSLKYRCFRILKRRCNMKRGILEGNVQDGPNYDVAKSNATATVMAVHY